MHLLMKSSLKDASTSESLFSDASRNETQERCIMKIGLKADTSPKLNHKAKMEGLMP